MCELPRKILIKCLFICFSLIKTVNRLAFQIITESNALEKKLFPEYVKN